MTLPRQFFRFLMVGGIGFVVDAGTLQIMVQFFGVGPYLGRVISYLVAATVTWLLNRQYTFRDNANTADMKRQWLSYVAVNAIGGGINYLTYAGCVMAFEIVRQHLVLGVAAGSIVALLINFSANKFFVFRR